MFRVRESGCGLGLPERQPRQVILAAQHVDWTAAQQIRRGDQLVVRGFPRRTRTGEPSLVATDLQLLAPCLRALPSAHDDLTPALRRLWEGMRFYGIRQQGKKCRACCWVLRWR